MRVIVPTDTLRNAKAIALLGESLGLLPHQILRFDRETSSEDLQREFADRPDEFLERHDIRLLIHSPSLTSGVSIEGDHFDLCTGFFEGQTIAPDDVLQSLTRDRKPIPRIVYVSHYGKYDPVIAATRKADYLEQSQRRSKVIGKVLGEAIETRLDDPIDEYHAATQADRNSKMICFSSSVRALLERAGHRVTIGKIMSGDPKLWRDLVKKSIEADQSAIATAPIIDALSAGDLRAKKSLLHREALQLARYDLCDWYEIEPEALSIADIEFDRHGRTRRDISRTEGITYVGLTKAKDLHMIGQLKSHNAPIQSHDLPGRELASQAAIALGVDEMIATAIKSDGWHMETPWVKNFAAKMRANSADARIALGWNFTSKITDTQIVGQVLRAYGLATQHKHMGSDGSRYRLYTITPESLDRLKAIMQRRATRHTEKGFQPRTSKLTEILLGSVYATSISHPKDSNQPHKSTIPATGAREIGARHQKITA
jgi:hypothetical protein